MYMKGRERESMTDWVRKLTEFTSYIYEYLCNAEFCNSLLSEAVLDNQAINFAVYDQGECSSLWSRQHCKYNPKSHCNYTCLDHWTWKNYGVFLLVPRGSNTGRGFEWCACWYVSWIPGDNWYMNKYNVSSLNDICSRRLPHGISVI